MTEAPFSSHRWYIVGVAIQFADDDNAVCVLCARYAAYAADAGDAWRIVQTVAARDYDVADNAITAGDIVEFEDIGYSMEVRCVKLRTPKD